MTPYEKLQSFSDYGALPEHFLVLGEVKFTKEPSYFPLPFTLLTDRASLELTIWPVWKNEQKKKKEGALTDAAQWDGHRQQTRRSPI